MDMRSVWYKVAIVLTGINVLGVAYAAVMMEVPHAALHVVLAGAFGYWARRLREQTPEVDEAALLNQNLADQVIDLHRQLSETQQRLDFADQLLSKRQKELKKEERKE